MYFFIPILFLCMLFPSCSSDDDTNPNITHRIYGISASGSPIKGTVTIRGSSGNTVDCGIDTDGFFSADVSSLTAPYLLNARGTVNDMNVNYYSYTSGSGRVNISQLTHAAVSMALRNDASVYYTNYPDANLPDANDIYDFAQGINLLLSDSYQEVGLINDFNFFYDEFSTNATGFDLLLDRILLSISSATATVIISEKDTNIPIFMHDMNTDQNLYFLIPDMVADILVLDHCSPYYQTVAIDHIMYEFYLWNQYNPEYNPEDYPTPVSYLEAIKYSKDRWSAIIPKNVFDSYVEDSAYVGLGFYMGYDIHTNLRISFVYPDSPADLAGLTRGDIILEINHIPASEISSQNDSPFGDDTPGEEVPLKIKKNNGNIHTLNLIKQELKVSSVLYSSIIDLNAGSIGYLVFNDFIMTAIDELDPVFKHFKESEISELVLDLRYNSGGIINIAQYLASLIGGSKVVNQTLCKLKYNDDSSYMNKTYQFVEVENSLDLDRLIVITTGASCSASEAIINGLKPYIDVVVIGNPSCGKPVGMNPFNVCDIYFLPVTYEVVNALDEGDYFDGIGVDCFALDDLERPFGDVNENLLSESLYYIENKQCSYRKRHKGNSETRHFPLHGFRQEIGAF